MVALAGVVWSLQGFSIRMVEVASSEQIIFWRSISQVIALLGVIGVVNRGRIVYAFRRAGYRGLVGSLCSLCAGTSFVFALGHTTVANLVFVMAASPLCAAVIAWCVLGERIELRTWVAMFVALAGIGVMMSEGLAGGNILGMFFSILTTVSFAGLAVVARWGGGLNMLPAVCLGALFTIIFGYVLSGGEVAAPLPDVIACFVSGGVLTATGATLFMSGAKYVPAGVLAFLTLTEIVLAPLWVWIGFGEMPGTLTVAGGAIVLVAILGEGVSRAMGSPAP